MARPLPVLLLLLAALSPLAAQSRLALDAKFAPATVRPGDQVVLEVEAVIEPGYHVYGRKDPNEPTKLVVRDAAGLVALGDPEIPDGSRHELFGIVGYWVEGKATLKQRFQVPAALAAGTLSVRGDVEYMACTPDFCDPPAKAEFKATLAVAAATPQDGAPASPVQAPDGSAAPRVAVRPEDKVHVSAAVEPAVARPGERVKLIVTVDVVEGWHVYGTLETIGIPITLEVSDPARLDGIALRGEPVVPPGVLHDAGSLQEHRLQGRFTIEQELVVASGSKPGERELAGTVPYQVCDENSCLPQTSVPFRAKVAIESGAARAEYAATASSAATAGTAPPRGAEGSLLLLLLLCVGGGLFALAMPCTYPMIPITFSFFTKQAEKRHGKVLPLALCYGIGIVLMFMVVGVALSAVIVDVVNHWVTNAVIGTVFVLFAMVLFGWVDLQPPAFLQRAAGRAGAAGGYLGVFFMGATLVITSFTCTAPIVGTLLANVASYGTGRVALGMAVFGVTMALPFVVLSLVPTRVKQMPRSGEWMETLKVSLGFVELAASLKFVSMVDISLGWQLLPRELFLMLWATIFGLWALYLFGILRKPGTPNDGVGGGRMASGMLVSGLAAYFLFGALGYRLDFVMTNFVPGYSAEVVVARAGVVQGNGAERTVAAHALVKDDAAAAVAQARREGKLLLYNFTGFN